MHVSAHRREEQLRDHENGDLEKDNDWQRVKPPSFSVFGHVSLPPLGLQASAATTIICMHDLLHRMLICCRTRPPCTTPQLARAHPFAPRFAPSWCLSRCSAARFLRATHTVTVGRQMHEELLCVSLSFAKPLCIWFRGEEKPAHTYRRSSLFIPQGPEEETRRAPVDIEIVKTG